MNSPPPEKVWYGNKKYGNTPGYSSNPEKAKANGIGNLFVQPNSNAPEQLEFLLVIDVSVQHPIAASRNSDQEVRFVDRQVSLSPEEKFNIVKSGPQSPDLILSSSPSNLNVQ